MANKIQTDQSRFGSLQALNPYPMTHTWARASGVRKSRKTNTRIPTFINSRDAIKETRFTMRLELMRALAAMPDMPKSSRRLYGVHRLRFARWQAEQDKILLGTHRRIENKTQFKWRKSGRPKKLRNDPVWQLPKAERPLCGAKCRSGEPCRARVVVKGGGVLATRCRLHGGLSTGPKTEAGRLAIAASNRRRARETI